MSDQPAPAPIFTQADLDAIVARAMELGAGQGLTYKRDHLSMGKYGDGAEGLAMILVNAYHDKYDLIAAVQSTIEFMHGRCG